MISRFGLLGAIFALWSISALAWTAVENRLTTRFANDIDPNLPLPDYPRPQLVRSQWSNLNGIWSCAITQRDAAEPDQFPNQILVPFPIESSLSGIGQSVGPDHVVWYRRTFSTPVLRSGERLILNFGAVNWEATVYINGHLAGAHRGGYDPFSFD